MANVNEKKITKAVKFGIVADYFKGMDAEAVIGMATVKDAEIPVTAGMIAEAMTHEIGLLSKKNSGNSGKLTKLQEANVALADQIFDWMDYEKSYSVSDFSKGCPAVAGENPQKIRPLLGILMDSGKVKREEVKGKPMFTRAM